MQLTMSRQRTDTDVAVRYVTNRVLGDLLAVQDRLGESGTDTIRSLAHDVGVGLLHDCLDSLSLFLFCRGQSDPNYVYVYRRAGPGSFEASPHSGRITRDHELSGGALDFELGIRDRSTWDDLKQRGELLIRWQTCVGRSMEGMSARPDGGYASGEVGLSRTFYSR